VADYWLGTSNTVKRICREIIKDEMNLKVTQKSHNGGETYFFIQLMLGEEKVGEPVSIMLDENVDHDDLVYDLIIK
jgi:hypothetical protein